MVKKHEEDGEDKKVSERTITFWGYRVEVRAKPGFPKTIYYIEDRYRGKVIITDKWFSVSFPHRDDDAGIPLGDPIYQEHDVFPYASAMAMAWSILSRIPASEVDVRLVPYHIHYTSTVFKHENEAEMIGDTNDQ